MLDTSKMTLSEMGTIYLEAINTLEAINEAIAEAWDNGDKRQAKGLECGMDGHLDILFEIEEEIEKIFN